MITFFAVRSEDQQLVLLPRSVLAAAGIRQTAEALPAWDLFQSLGDWESFARGDRAAVKPSRPPMERWTEQEPSTAQIFAGVVVTVGGGPIGLALSAGSSPGKTQTLVSLS
jgi:hypothetical protein